MYPNFEHLDDVPVAEGGDRFGLAPKPRHPVVGSNTPQELHRDGSIQPVMLRLVHHTHPSPPELTYDPVRSDLLGSVRRVLGLRCESEAAQPVEYRDRDWCYRQIRPAPNRLDDRVSAHGHKRCATNAELATGEMCFQFGGHGTDELAEQKTLQHNHVGA
jgi:hypothetical protein